MARLIIGHTTHDSTRTWVRGTSDHPVAFVKLIGPGAPKEKSIILEERHGYTGVVDFEGLKHRTTYQTEVTFGAHESQAPMHRAEFGHCRGTFKTFPKPNAESALTFLIGSCNLHSLGCIQSPDPAFRRLTEVAHGEGADFMIHCGDQIYYDIPNPLKPPSVEEYREKYLDAWGDSRPTRKFLTMLPHYMILDDHEMTNDFSNDMKTPWNCTPASVIRSVSLKVYREFQHIRHPQDYGNQALYYDFRFGCHPFFVLDTRSERDTGRTGGVQQMIGETQMQHFLNWLGAHKDEVKFAVTSVPFVAEPHSSGDKWNAAPFQSQRTQIMKFLVEREIHGLTFLTGDMHCSYHTQLEISKDHKKVRVHELMSSPINQLQKSPVASFRTETGKTVDGISYKSTLKSSEFYAEHSNAMLVRVNGRRVSYEIFRTKKDRRRELARSYRFD